MKQTLEIERVKSPRVIKWREIFAQVAHECSARVRQLPKGQRFQAYKDCMRTRLREAHKAL